MNLAVTRITADLECIEMEPPTVKYNNWDPNNQWLKCYFSYNKTARNNERIKESTKIATSNDITDLMSDRLLQ